MALGNPAAFDGKMEVHKGEGSMKQDAIDFVVTWVDGNDPAWQADKAKYSPVNADVRPNRYRDWDQLQYWFRAVEKYAPWVNKIHFVTWGHIPQWLDTGNPKLHIVKHSDFIPEEYLPVFNSTAIEVHLHRIPGLSEQFVYFCDDFYLMQPCKPTDFFKNGKPVDMAELAPPQPHRNDAYYYHLFNDYSLYRPYATKKTLLRHVFKFCNWRYGAVAVRNMFHLLAHNIYFRPRHLCIPILKSTMETVWADNGEVLEQTARSRFRQITNNSPYLFRCYQFVTGNFCPGNIKGAILQTNDIARSKRIIEQGRYKFICMSDVSDVESFENDKKAINASFEKVFPERCSFER